MGERAEPTWGWERTARELYAAYDRRKADEVVETLEEGLRAGREGHYDVMMARFEFVLARHPLFERRGEMVEPLVAHARSLERTDATRAERVYRLALRVQPDGPQAASVRSAVLFLEAERALARGVADPELYRAALRADPSNRRAEAQLRAVAQVEVLKSRWRTRALLAFGLFTVALAMVGFLYARARRNSAVRLAGQLSGTDAADTAPDGPGHGPGGVRADEPTDRADRGVAA